MFEKGSSHLDPGSSEAWGCFVQEFVSALSLFCLS